MQERNYTRGRKRICGREEVELPSTCSERYLALESPHLLPLLAAGIRFAGLGLLDDGYRVKRIDPLLHSLIYTIEGSGIVDFGGRGRVLHPGSLFIGPAHLAHEYRITSAPWSIAWFCLEERNGIRCLPVDPLVLVSPFSNLMLETMRQLTDDPETAPHADTSILDGCVELVLSILRHDAESTLATSQQIQQRRLDAVFLAVHRNPSLPWSSAALIKHGHLPFSVDRLRQLCCELYGQPPMRRVRAIRMQIAKQLLRATDYPLRTIAPMVGYGNEFSLSTAFTKEMGMAPQEFRRGA